MGERDKDLSPETRLLHDRRYSEGAVAPPIYQTSLFTFENHQAMVERYAGAQSQAVYSRIDNPTNSVLHEKMAALECGEAALSFSSGMAAISNAIFSVVQSGDRILCIKNVYADTYRLLRGLCERFAIAVDFVDGGKPEEVEALLPGATLLYLESPNTWMFEEQNLVLLCRMARAAGVTTIADNSWASPVHQNPLELGVDIVVHSASKYISGHSDTVAGVAIGSKARMEKIASEVKPYLGASLSAQDAARLLRGLRTLPLRVERHHHSGLTIAERLSVLPEVVQVCHPGLAPQAFSALRGYGGLFSLEFDESVDIPRFCDALRLFRLGVSWGGYESLVVPAAVSLSQAGKNNAAVDFAVPERMVRLFVGLEDPADLWEDLSQALVVARTGDK